MRKRSGFLCVAVLLAGCRDMRAEANMAEAMNQLGVELTTIQQDYAILQQQVDSLGMVVARQDTLIRQLANLAGVAVPQR